VADSIEDDRDRNVVGPVHLQRHVPTKDLQCPGASAEGVLDLVENQEEMVDDMASLFDDEGVE